VSAGEKLYRFEVNASTIAEQHGVAIPLSSAGHGRQVSLHYHVIGPRMLATRIYLLVTPTRHPRSSVVSGIRMAGTSHGFALDTITGETLRVSYNGWTAPQELLSVRGYRSGAVIRSVRVRQLEALPLPSNIVRGTLVSFVSGVARIRAGSRESRATVIPSTRITHGAGSATEKALKRGEYVSLRYWSVGSRNYAAAIHVYAQQVSQPSTDKVVGTVTFVNATTLTISGPSGQKHLHIGAGTTVHLGSNLSSFSQVRRGQQVNAYFYCLRGTCTATSLHIYVRSTQGKSTSLPSSVTGTISAVDRGRLVLEQTAGRRQIEITPATKVYVKTTRIPHHWLFAGATATVALQYRGRSMPRATIVDFRPPMTTFSGEVLDAGPAPSVSDSTGIRRHCDLRVAQVYIDGHRGATRDVVLGSHVRVSGFLLPSGREAATMVVVSHPTVKVSGVVVGVESGVIDIRSASGAEVISFLAPGVRVWSAGTGQRFPVRAIPLLVHISGEGTNVGGRIRLTAAAIVLKKASISGYVTSVSSSSIAVQLSDRAVKVWIGNATKIVLGSAPLLLNLVEKGDLVTCVGYPDVRGGINGSSVTVHRTLVTRSGTIVLLSRSGFDLVLTDGSLLHVGVSSSTVVSQIGTTISFGDLRNNDEVTVHGSLRPASFTIDATLIELI
jgi:hypothetical protein